MSMKKKRKENTAPPAGIWDTTLGQTINAKPGPPFDQGRYGTLFIIFPIAWDEDQRQLSSLPSEQIIFMIKIRSRKINTDVKIQKITHTLTTVSTDVSESQAMNPKIAKTTSPENTEVTEFPMAIMNASNWNLSEFNRLRLSFSFKLVTTIKDTIYIGSHDLFPRKNLS